MKATTVDLFCGGGITSQAIEEAFHLLNKPTTHHAINHNETALKTHKLNHPDTHHHNDDLNTLNPRHIIPKEGILDLLWASPECTNHSKAKSGRTVNEQSRATAWCIAKWAEQTLPKIILVENVGEFKDWGPLIRKSCYCKKEQKNIWKYVPDPKRKGETFRAWIAIIESLGYKVDHRLLRAADYGDPTSRTRLFVQAVRGNRKIYWPNPTHLKKGPDLLGTQLPWNTAEQCIDWTIPSVSIFDRHQHPKLKPLVENTLRRIYTGFIDGLQNSLLHHKNKDSKNPHPALTKAFITAIDHASSKGVWNADDPLSTITTKARHCLVQPLIKPYITELINNQSTRDLSEPITTIRTSGGHHALTSVAIEPYLLPQQSAGKHRPVTTKPAPTVATAGAISLIRPYLISYYGNGTALNINKPLNTVTTKERFGLIEVLVKHTIDNPDHPLIIDIAEPGDPQHLVQIDILFRMLQNHELAAAQGFPPHYKFAGTKTEIAKQIGNAVPKNLAKAICLAALAQTSDITRILTQEKKSA